jgi:hypothetical protein
MACVIRFVCGQNTELRTLLSYQNVVKLTILIHIR